MEQLAKFITDERTGLKYELCGDYYIVAGGDETFNRLVEQMAKREGVSEQLKINNQLEWVCRMNNIHQRATEIANHELIYA